MNMRNKLLEARYMAAESSAELYPAVMWKAEFASDEIVPLAEELSKQRVEHIGWLLLAA